MKRKLESELMQIAQRILDHKGRLGVDDMHAEVVALYEKMTVLKFANNNLESGLPTIDDDASFFTMLDAAFNNKVSDTIAVGDKTYVDLDDNQEDEIMEPVIEKIKDIVAQMPPETQQVDDLIAAVIPKIEYGKNDLESITAGFEETPIFDPVSNLSDDLKISINIGPNDKLIFVEQLFDGQSTDYDRVISQLNTSASFEEAKHLILNVIKPDYNNWEGKEGIESFFLKLIEAKFV